MKNNYDAPSPNNSSHNRFLHQDAQAERENKEFSIEKREASTGIEKNGVIIPLDKEKFRQLKKEMNIFNEEVRKAKEIREKEEVEKMRAFLKKQNE